MFYIIFLPRIAFSTLCYYENTFSQNKDCLLINQISMLSGENTQISRSIYIDQYLYYFQLTSNELSLSIWEASTVTSKSLLTIATFYDGTVYIGKEPSPFKSDNLMLGTVTHYSIDSHNYFLVYLTSFSIAYDLEKGTIQNLKQLQYYLSPVTIKDNYLLSVPVSDKSIINIYTLDPNFPTNFTLIGNYSGHDDDITAIIWQDYIYSIDYHQNVHQWNVVKGYINFTNAYRLQYGWTHNSVFRLDKSDLLLVLPFTGNQYQIYNITTGNPMLIDKLTNNHIEGYLWASDINNNLLVAAQGETLILSSVYGQVYYRSLFENQEEVDPLQRIAMNDEMIIKFSLSGGSVLINSITLSPLRNSLTVTLHFQNEDSSYPYVTQQLIKVQLCGELASYYQGSCLQCLSPCAGCVYKPYHCTSCFEGFYLDGYNCIQDGCRYPCQACRNSDQSCSSCVSSQYLEQGVCAQCTEKCLTCASQDLCLSCRFGKFLKEYICYDCVSPCKECYNLDYCVSCTDGYYPDKINLGECLKCVSPCGNCVDEYQCIDCLPEFYMVDEPYAVCKPCPVGCLKCTERICYQCKQGYMFTQNLCYKCDDVCEECDAQPNQCTKCAGQRLSAPQCNVCGEGYYLDQHQIQCQWCHFLCQTCHNQRIDSCKSCYQKHNTTLKVTKAKTTYCICKKGYYFDKQLICQRCDSLTGCALCSKGRCTKCQKEYIAITQDSIQICVSKIKPKCGEGCLKCDVRDLSYCYQCQPQYFIYLHSCYIICPQGTYPVKNQCVIETAQSFEDFESKLSSVAENTGTPYQIFLFLIEILGIVYPGILFIVTQINVISCLGFSSALMAPNFKMFLYHMNQVSPNLSTKFWNFFSPFAMDESDNKYQTTRNFNTNKIYVRSIIHYGGGFISEILALFIFRNIVYLLWMLIRANQQSNPKLYKLVKLFLVMIDNFSLVIIDGCIMGLTLIALSSYDGTRFIYLQEQLDVIIAISVLGITFSYIGWQFFISQQSRNYFIKHYMLFSTNSKQYYQFQLRDTSDIDNLYTKAAITTYRLQNIAIFFFVPIFVTQVRNVEFMLISILILSTYQAIYIIILYPEKQNRANILEAIVGVLMVVQFVLLLYNHFNIKSEIEFFQGLHQKNLQIVDAIDLLFVPQCRIREEMMLIGGVQIAIALLIVLLKFLSGLIECIIYMYLNRAQIRRKLWKICFNPFKAQIQEDNTIYPQVPARVNEKIEINEDNLKTQEQQNDNVKYDTQVTTITHHSQKPEFYLEEMLSKTQQLEGGPLKTIFDDHTQLDQSLINLINEQDTFDEILFQVGSSLLVQSEFELLRRNADKVTMDFTVHNLRVLLQVGMLINQTDFDLSCEIIKVVDFFIKKLTDYSQGPLYSGAVDDSYRLTLFWVRVMQVFTFKVLYSFYREEQDDLVFFVMKVSRYIMVNDTIY